MKRLIAACALIAVLSPGIAMATPGSGFAGTELGRVSVAKGKVALTQGADPSELSPAWVSEFTRVHGRAPTWEDQMDRLWSVRFLARTGREPSREDWLASSSQSQQQTNIWSTRTPSVRAARRAGIRTPVRTSS